MIFWGKYMLQFGKNVTKTDFFNIFTEKKQTLNKIDCKLYIHLLKGRSVTFA